ncbi:MAG: ACT domain-containing protein [Promethearchaeota archaeon]
MVTQISVFLPNKPNQLSKVTDALMNAEINIRALTVSETADYGILRMIVSDPEKALEHLRKNNFLVDQTDVLAVELKDKPGGLNEIAKLLGESEINIEYLYAYLSRAKDQAILILRVNDKIRSKTIDILESNKIKIFSPEEIYGL